MNSMKKSLKNENKIKAEKTFLGVRSFPDPVYIEKVVKFSTTMDTYKNAVLKARIKLPCVITLLSLLTKHQYKLTSR